MIKHLFIFVLIISSRGYVIAQDSRSVESSQQKVSSIQLTPEQHSKVLKAFNNHPYTRYYDRLIVEYEKRMKSNARKYKVMARKMEKPQYSDFSYFGHKRKPKKRPAGKMKYCKECKMVH
ncbi:MAG: hypothetical protein ABFS32_05305 [Bacteroidota bacterium]